MLCRLYGRDPESLGLVVWRTPEERRLTEEMAERNRERHLAAMLYAQARREAIADVRAEERERISREARARIRGMVEAMLRSAMAALEADGRLPAELRAGLFGVSDPDVADAAENGTGWVYARGDVAPAD